MSKQELQGTGILGFRRAEGRGDTFAALNPANGERLQPSYHTSSREDLQTAARLARQAFGPYSELPAGRRADFLRAIAAEIEALGDDLIERVMAETALPEARVRSERGRTCGQLRFFADIVAAGHWVDARIDTADPGRAPVPKPDVRSMLRPLGPVAVFGASNFPLAFSTAGGDTASALAAGCPVVGLAHYSHPGTAEMVGVAIQRAAEAEGMPEGVFSLLFSAGKELGAALVQHPEIAAVGFTGSRAGGMALLQLAQTRPKPIPLYAEMSSVNPVFLLPGAVRKRGEQIVPGLHNSVTLHAGQFCTNPGLIFLDRSQESDSFMETFVERMRGTQPADMLNATISASYWRGIERRKGKTGVELLAATSEQAEGSCRSGAVLFQVEAAAFLRDPALQEEIFGPSTIAIRYDGWEQVLAAVDSLEGALTATIHAEESDLEQARALLQRLERKCGRVIFNGYPTGVEVCQAMVHGGPWPSTSDARMTSVGGRAIDRFARPVCFQDVPEAMLPPELRNANPRGIVRLLNGRLTDAAVE